MVYIPQSAPYKAMDIEVFFDKEVGERMAEDYVSLKIDKEKSPYRKELLKYRFIKGYPRLLIIDSKGLEIGRMYGRRTLAEFNTEIYFFWGDAKKVKPALGVQPIG